MSDPTFNPGLPWDEIATAMEKVQKAPEPTAVEPAAPEPTAVESAASDSTAVELLLVAVRAGGDCGACEESARLFAAALAARFGDRDGFLRWEIAAVDRDFSERLRSA